MLFRPRPKRCDFLAIGDCVVDVFLIIEEATITCEIKHEICKLCLTYGEKVPLKSIAKIAGAGNASNAAIGAARLGWKSTIQSIIGQDLNGQEISATWKREGVNTDLVQIDPVHETNYHTVLHFRNERTILIFHQPREYHLPSLPETRWLYYTSLGKNHERLESQLLRYLHTHPETKVIFQPGTFQLRRGKAALTRMISQSTILAMNKQEAQHLLERTSESISELAKGLHDLGAQIVVITDGKAGSYASDGKTLWYCPIFPVEVTEVTGAGDSYTLGFAYGYDRTGSLPEAMRYGTANSWSVVQYVGPHKGLLTARGMNHALKTFAHIRPVEYTDAPTKNVAAKRARSRPKR